MKSFWKALLIVVLVLGIVIVLGAGCSCDTSQAVGKIVEARVTSGSPTYMEIGKGIWTPISQSDTYTVAVLVDGCTYEIKEKDAYYKYRDQIGETVRVRIHTWRLYGAEISHSAEF